MEEKDIKVFLDTETKDDQFRMTTFSDKVSELLIDFKDWVRERNVTPDNLEYADMFRVNFESDEIPTRFATVLLLDDKGSIDVVDAPDDINPFTRKKKGDSLLCRIKKLFSL